MRVCILFAGLFLSSFTGIWAQSSAGTKKDFVYRLVEMRASVASPERKELHIHSFTYDKKGQPAYHRMMHLRSGKLSSKSRIKFTYDADGKLLAQDAEEIISYDAEGKPLPQIVDQSLRYEYNKNAGLVRVSIYLSSGKEMQLFDETLLEEKEDPSGRGKLVLVTYNRKRTERGKIGSAMDNFCRIEYTMDSSNRVRKAKFLSFDYAPLQKPREYIYC